MQQCLHLTKILLQSTKCYNYIGVQSASLPSTTAGNQGQCVLIDFSPNLFLNSTNVLLTDTSSNSNQIEGTYILNIISNYY